MGKPEDGEDDEADDPGDKLGDERGEAVNEIPLRENVRMFWQLQFDHEQRHRNREDRVGQGLDAMFGIASRSRQ